MKIPISIYNLKLNKDVAGVTQNKQHLPYFNFGPSSRKRTPDIKNKI